MPAAKRPNAAFPPGLEVLEVRLFLAGPAVAPAWFEIVDRPAGPEAAAATTVPAAREAVRLWWQGRTIDVARDEWILRFTPEATSGMAGAADAASLLAPGGVDFRVVRGLGMAGQVLIRTPGADPTAVEAWLSGSAALASFGPNRLVTCDSLPDDGNWGLQWSMPIIQAPQAWDIVSGNPSVVVAVVDTGVAYLHPDLAANRWINPGEIADNGLDDDGNGFVDDVGGWDFVDNDSSPGDPNTHGTHVAGIIGAVGDNGIGVAGVNWSTSIMALRFMDASGSGWISDSVLAINYATMMRNLYGVNVRVINASYGSTGGSDAAEEAAIAAAGAAGILFVAAAGNDGVDADTAPHYPSCYALDNIISVANSDANDHIVGTSNYGRTTVDLAAPGDLIYSTVTGQTYTYKSGTSMAAPHVAGVAALAWSIAPAATYQQIRDAILRGADPLPAADLGKTVTDGRLNALGALRELGARFQGTCWNDLDGDGARDAGEPARPNATVYLDANGNGIFDPRPCVFVSTDVPKAILEGFSARTYSNLTVSGLPVQVADVDVRLDITHTRDGDVSVNLFGPDGTVVGLLAFVGGSGDNFTGTILDDSATIPIASGSAPFTGRYRPRFPLAPLSGKDPNGTWRLEVRDVVTGEVGTLTGWSLMFTLPNAADELSVVTDKDGRYAFAVAPGDYTVRQVPLNAGDVASTPAPQQVSVPAGGVVSAIDFGTVDGTRIEGIEWLDSNGNGIREAGESGLAGWRVYLDVNTSCSWDGALEPCALTQTDGAYVLVVPTGTVAPGTYGLRTEFPAGWQQTYPPSGPSSFALTPGVTYAAMNFGNRLLPPEIAVWLGPDPISASQAAAIDIGTVIKGSPAPQLVFTVTNEGGEQLTLGTLSVPAGWTVVKPPPDSLGLLASDTFILSLGTLVSGTFAGTVSFSTNDADGGDGVENPFSFPVTGIVGAPSQLTVASDPLDYQENAPPLALDGDLTVTDSDIPALVGARIQITGNYVPGQDILVFADQNGITASFDAAAGLLTLAGAASVADYQEALRTVRYFNGREDPDTAARTVSLTVNNGLMDSNTATRILHVVAVNDAPVSVLPAVQVIDEDADLVFSAATGSAVAVNDPDAGSNPIQVTLTATSGTLTLGSIAGLDFTEGAGMADGTMTFTGTLAAVNAALDGMVFRPARDYSGLAAIQMTTNDLGATGAGGPLTDTARADFAVRALNDAPVNTIPAPQTVNEDTSLAFSAACGNPLSVSDADAGTDLVQVTLMAIRGAITLSGTTGLAFTAGDGMFDAITTFTGTLASVNAALDAMVFCPSQDYNGPAGIQITTDDLGSTGDNGPMADTDYIDISVNAVNDAPVNARPAAQTVGEDSDLVFSAARGNALAVTDVDAASSALSVTLTATDGLLTLGGTAALTFTAGDGAADTTMTFTGTLDDINAALDGLVFRPAQDYNGSASVQITTDDQGNTGSGGALTDSDTLDITVTPANDAPSFSLGADASANEDGGTQTVAEWAKAISPGPADEWLQTLAFELTTDNDALFATEPAISQSGTLTYTPAPNANGAATVTVVLKDDGGTADGGVDTSAPQTFVITVNPVNDVPVATPASVAMDGDTPTDIALSGIDETPADQLVYTIATPPAHGSLAPKGAAGGREFVYTPDPGFVGLDSFAFTVTDSGDRPGSHDHPGDLTSAPARVDLRVGQPVLYSNLKRTAPPFTDARGNTVTVSWTGAGTVEFIFAHALPCDLGRLTFTPTDPKVVPALTISVRASKVGGSPTSGKTNVGTVVVNGSLTALAAGAVSMTGDLTVTGTLGRLTLDNLTGGGTLTIGGTAAKRPGTTYVFDRVTDTAIQSEMPIASITATEWVNTPASAVETIEAPWLGTLTTKGLTATKTTPAVAGGFGANLTLSGAGVTSTGRTLSSANIKGSAAPSLWDVTGKVGSVTINGCVGASGLPWELRGATGVGSLTLGDVTNAVVNITGESGAIKAKRWLDGSIQAARVASITVAGTAATLTAPAVSGDFAADVTVTGAGKTTLTMAVAGWLDGAAIASPNGPLGSIALGGIRNSAITAGDNLTQTLLSRLTVKGIKGQSFSFINSTVSAWTLGTISVKGVQADNGNQAHGITGHRITTSYTRDGKRLAGPAVGPRVVEQVDDFLVELV